MSEINEPELRHVGITLEGVPPMKRSQRESDIFGFWAFLMSDAVVFACVFAIYGTMLHGTAGHEAPAQRFDINSAFLETVALLTSSFTYGMVSLSLRQGARRRWIAFWLGITFCLGGYFLHRESHDFIDMFQHGITPETDGAASSFFVLVGTHGVHVTCGLIWILVMSAQMAIHGIDERVKTNFIRLGLFWHFLDIVWVFIFTVVYLQGLIYR